MSETNISMICRLCLNNSFLHYNIFADNSTDINPTYEVINYVYGLQITIDDGLPGYICENCLAMVKAFKVYKNNAHKAVSEIIRMRENINNVVVKQEEIIEDLSPSVEATECQERFPETEISGRVPHESFRQSDAENSQSDGSSCEEKPVELSSSDVEEAATNESSAYRETGEKVRLRESLSSCPNPLASTSRNSALVASRVLEAGRLWSRHLSQSESQMDGCNYEEKTGELSSSDTPESATFGSNVCRETGKETISSESLSRHSLMEDSSSLASTSTSSKVVGGSSNGLRGCSSDSLCVNSVDVTKQGTDPLQTGNCDRITEKSFRCDVCGKELKNQKTLDRHKLGIHSVGEPYQCEICGKAFRAKHLLTIHSIFHRESPRYSCPECGKGFPLKHRLTAHLRIHGVKAYQCAHCGSDFSSKVRLEKHYPVHDGVVNWSCDICGEECRKWSDLAGHMDMHEVGRVYKCATCDAEYSKKRDLRNHVYVHTRPHTCLTCNKAFPTKTNLRLHSYTHSGIKLHECQICNKRFSQKGSVTIHLKTHSEERPFPCALCSYRGGSESQLRRHVHKHSTSERYKCGFYQKTYGTIYKKIRHERKFHKDMVTE